MIHRRTSTHREGLQWEVNQTNNRQAPNLQDAPEDIVSLLADYCQIPRRKGLEKLRGLERNDYIP